MTPWRIAAVLPTTPWWYLVGQVGGGTGDITSVITLIGQIGLSSIFLWQWLRLDKERQEDKKIAREDRAALVTIIERQHAALGAAMPLLDRAATVIAGVSHQAASSIQHASSLIPDHVVVARLELAIDDLKSQIRDMTEQKTAMELAREQRAREGRSVL